MGNEEVETASVDRGLENFGSMGEWRNWGWGGAAFFFLKSRRD